MDRLEKVNEVGGERSICSTCHNKDYKKNQIAAQVSPFSHLHVDCAFVCACV